MMAEENKDDNHKERKDLTLNITLRADTGALEVHAPGDGKLYDEPMCDWLLKKAGRFIENHNNKAMQPKIIQPNFGGRIRGAFGKRR